MTANLTEKKRTYYKERLAHYLRSHRDRNNLTQADTAEKLGCTIDYLKRLENGSEDRIANIIEYLMNFAALDFSSVIDFLAYLENNRDPQDRKDLYPWELALLEGFHEQSGEARRNFISSYCGKKPKSDVPLSEALDLLHAVSTVGLRERKIILFMISKFQKNPLTDEENEALDSY